MVNVGAAPPVPLALGIPPLPNAQTLIMFFARGRTSAAVRSRHRNELALLVDFFNLQRRDMNVTETLPTLPRVATRLRTPVPASIMIHRRRLISRQHPHLQPPRPRPPAVLRRSYSLPRLLPPNPPPRMDPRKDPALHHPLLQLSSMLSLPGSLVLEYLPSSSNQDLRVSPFI